MANEEKKMSYKLTANPLCTLCGGDGYLSILNVYDPDYEEVEQCPSCSHSYRFVNYRENKTD